MERSSSSPWRRFVTAREASVLILLVLLLALMAFSEHRDRFFRADNLQNLSRQIALLAIFSIGEAIVVIVGGIDLSLGSLIAASGMWLAWTLTRMAEAGYSMGVTVAAAIAVTLALSALLGTFHATLIHYLRLPPFVVTLASLRILLSVALLTNQQLPIPIVDFRPVVELANGYLYIQGTSFGVPKPVLILVVVLVVMELIMRRTQMGRYVYSVGSNEEAARLSGVPVFRVRWFAYGMSAVLCGLAGILYAGFGNQGDPRGGQSYELNAITAAVIGGASLAGGEGSVMGTFLGACLLQVILGIINQTIRNPSLWQGIVVGGVLLATVIFNELRRRRMEKA